MTVHSPTDYGISGPIWTTLPLAKDILKCEVHLYTCLYANLHLVQLHERNVEMHTSVQMYL